MSPAFYAVCAADGAILETPACWLLEPAPHLQGQVHETLLLGPPHHHKAPRLRPAVRGRPVRALQQAFHHRPAESKVQESGCHTRMGIWAARLPETVSDFWHWPLGNISALVNMAIRRPADDTAQQQPDLLALAASATLWPTYHVLHWSCSASCNLCGCPEYLSMLSPVKSLGKMDGAAYIRVAQPGHVPVRSVQLLKAVSIHV